MNKFSTRLVNYVEPVIFNGLIKTVFYTEFNTNFEKGDKVFIINGNYDSNSIIQSETYDSQTIGYTVLQVDRCKIILDIDYTGIKPSNDDYTKATDEYIKVYHITSQREFDYINSLTTTTYNNNFYSKFEHGLSNNIIYVDSAFTGTSSVIAYNLGVPSSGFYQKQQLFGIWTLLTGFLGTSSIYFKITGSSPTYSLINNGKLKIVGEDINVSSQIFKQRVIYVFNQTSNKWEIDGSSIPSYISKLNFRKGIFKGDWNDGVYGSYDSQIIWNEGNWNSGVLLNAKFVSGTINSKTNNNSISQNNYANTGLSNPTFIAPTTIPFNIAKYNSATPSRTLAYNTPVKQLDSSLTQTYYCKLDKYGLPLQSTDFSNNKNYGFNYIIDSDIETGSIVNGNFENCNIGLTNFMPITGHETRPYGTASDALTLFYTNDNSFDYKLKIQGGSFKFCDINTAAFKNSYITDCNIKNSNINTSTLASNQIENSVVIGDYSVNTIKIINADLWSYFNGLNRGVLKLYISDSDLLRLNNFDSIYIDRLNKELYLSSFNDENKVWLNYENKYIFDIFNNSELSSDTIIISFKDKTDNKFKTYIDTTITPTTMFIANNNNYASIDIDLGSVISWYQTTFGSTITKTYADPIITADTVSNLFTNTNISNSNFESGILVNSNWKNGDSINKLGNVIRLDENKLSISIPLGSTTSIYVDISNQVYNSYDSIKLNDKIWLHGITYINTSGSQSDISGIYQVENIELPVYTNTRRIKLYDFDILMNKTNTKLGSLVPGGTFSIGITNPNYISLHRFKIENSTINEGLFKNTLLINSNVSNVDFDNLDAKLTISNISKLRFINTLFKDDNNKVNSGIIYKSHILNTYWNNGIAFNSILSGQKFSNGIFKNGYWLNGIFNNGIFIDSDDLLTSTQSYDNNTGYYRSWRNGTFNNGQFYNSIWIEGIFNNGRLFNSRWYGGVWNNGILGLKNSPYLNTTMGYYSNLGTGSNITYWYNGTVDSAIVGGYSDVYWYSGKFNDGSFFSFGSQSESIWYNGDFNGGKFEGVAKWKNGTFNRGKFLSYYGWTLSSSTASSDYTWENGKFNNGQFGQQSLGTNSTWFDGEFNNGSFYGRVWNNGIFHGGIFNGSYTNSVSTNEINFVNSFINSYYGLWRNGYFTDTISLGRPDQMVYTEIRRASESVKKTVVSATIQNALWLNGIFSHANGTTKNIAWLDGTFLKGKFNNSSFNPYVDKTLSGATPSFNFDSSCYWKNGTFDGGRFYISEWKDGIFNNGFMQGAIWRNGTWFYGTADNLYWEKGTWKNGNWFGTNFNYLSVTSSLSITDVKTKSILYNVASASNSRHIHILNAFTGSSIESLYDPSFDITAIGDYNGWTNSTLQPNPPASLSGDDWIFDISYTRWDRIPAFPAISGSWIGVSVVNNNYQLSTSNASKFLYAYATFSGGFTTSIFNQNKSYTITADLYVNINNDVLPIVNIELWMGLTYSLHTINTRGLSTIYKTYTANEVFFWTSGFTASKLAIKKRASTGTVEVSILKLSAKQTNIIYDDNYNNKLYLTYGSTPSLSGTISLPNLTLQNETDVSVRFGNGKFVSGVWENGIWNNGYRSDDTLTLCDLYPVAYYIKVSSTLHRLQLQFINNSIKPPFKIGDYVSVGNVVAIDVNNNRRIVNDKFRVVSISRTEPYNSIVLEYILNTPILEITKDSPNHLIYVSKNVWLSGGFLNGYFNGIWNYGLFNGYPYITKMENSHWLNGIFDGGHFKSSIASVTYSLTSEVVSYSTGLIQKFNFTDKNVAPVNKFLYQSWIDVNYVDESQTNLYQDKNYYDTSDGINTTLSKPNLNGFITYDILSSNSYFKNGYDNNSKRYSLGSKYKKYVNYLQDIGEFTNLFSNTTQYESLGMDNFTNDGWTVKSLIDGVSSGTVSVGGIILYPEKFTINNIDSTLNIISSTFAVGGVFPSTSKQNYIILNNINTEDIPSLRYSMVEYNVLSFTGFPGPTAGNPRAFANNISYYPPAVNFMINPATWSLNQRPANHLYTSSDVKREYFYNRRSLLMQFIGGGVPGYATYPLDIKIDNLSFYEVDSIPFFQYTTQSNVDSSVQIPLSATAPFINYNSANFNYVGNITLNFDVNSISNQSSVYNISNSGNIFLVSSSDSPSSAG